MSPVPARPSRSGLGPLPSAAAAAVLSAALLAAGCDAPPRAEEPGAGTPDAVAVHGSEGSGGVNAPRWLDAPYVVLVSIDGFGADYPERFPTPALDRLAARGVRAERMIPPFPTKTFPAHYTVVTGLHPESHGLVGNTFHDPALDATYRIGDREKVQDGRWYRGEPLWVAAERQGMVTASYYWVGSEAPVRGIRPSTWKPFDGSVPEAARVDSVLDWLSRPPARRPHLVTLYFEGVDEAGHEHGPRAPATGEAVALADRQIGRLLDGIAALPHGDRVYVVVVSDHGMATWRAEDVIPVDMDRYPGVEMVTGGTYASLRIREGGPARARAVRDSLRAEVGSRAEVYLRSEVPERLRYREDPRIGDLVVVPGPPGMVVPSGVAAGMEGGHTHGWDNAMEEMGAVFVAAGPGLPAGEVIPPFEAVHVHPFLARVLGLDAPAVDGDAGVLGRWLEEEGGTGATGNQ